MEILYSLSILDAEGFVKVPDVERVTEILLDDRNLSKSALRALDILEFFATRQRPARATEVARALELSPSSADQLLKTLVSRAYLIFDVAHKLYHPSPRLLGFAASLEKTYFGGGALRALMQELVERTGCAIGISTPFGRLMQFVDCALPKGKHYGRSPGHVFPLFGSAAGCALLSTWPLETVRTLIAQSEDQLGAFAGNPENILDRLAEVRANGHAFGGLSEHAQMCSIAIALPRASLGTELAISIRGSVDDLSARRWRLAALAQQSIDEHIGNRFTTH